MAHKVRSAVRSRIDAEFPANALLRDKRFGRQILRIPSRDELVWPAPKLYTADFNLTESYALLAPERTLINGK